MSGINRGDNCGLHVIYSGTVGAAREAACKGIPALAFSLDSHSARSEEQYESAAQYSLTIIKAVLGILPQLPERPLISFAGYVVNCNFPSLEIGDIKGVHICHQGQHCSLPEFQEVDTDPHFTSKNEHTYRELHMGEVTMKAFRNAVGYLQEDQTPGSDSWAVANGWVALTLVGLLSDVPLTAAAALGKVNNGAGKALVKVSKATAAAMNVDVGGVPDGL